MYKCSLPWPPSVNTYYTVWKGRKILSKKGKAFKEQCKLYVHRLPEPMKSSLAVTITVTPPDKRKRDLDNLLKPMLDVLTMYGVYEDDSQIVDLHIKKVAGEKGKIIVTVKELNDVQGIS